MVTGVSKVDARVQGNGKIHLDLIVGELPDLGDKARGGQRNPGRAHAEARAGRDPADRLHDLCVIGERLSHPHEKEVGRRASRVLPDEQDLIDDFSRAQLAFEGDEPRSAEPAAVGPV